MTDHGDDPDAVLKAALEYAERGWWVFPVMGARGGETAAKWKAPYGLGRWSVESTRDYERITKWFKGNSDLGVALDMGRSGLVALDGDHPQGLIEWAGMDVLEPAPSWRGNPLRRSWIFRQPESGPIGCPIREWGEIKGAGGYMIAPPSPHPIGGRYEWLAHKINLPPLLPEDIAEQLRTGISGRGIPKVADATPDEVRAFFEKYSTSTRPDLLQTVVSKYNESVANGAGRYPSLRDCLIWGFEEAVAGLYSAKEVAIALGAAFREDLSEHPARPWDPAEWNRVLSWAVGRASVTDVDDRLRRASATEMHVTLLDVDTTDITDPGEVDLAMEAYNREVRVRARALKVDKDARRMVAAADYLPAPAVISLAELMNESTEPLRWRVGGPSVSDDAFAIPGGLDNTGLMSFDASVILTGIRKSGKTSLVLDLVRCMADGEQFLGRFPVDRPDGGIFVMDYESTRDYARRWYTEAHITHPERIFLKLLRGQPNPYATDNGREDLIAELKASGASVLIVDPLSVLLENSREDENDNMGTRKGLDDLRRLADEAGVREVIVIAHTGKDGAKGARGASSIEDWPDAIWRIQMEGEGMTATRTFSAFGRDVDLEPGIIEYADRRPILVKTRVVEESEVDVVELQRKADIYKYLHSCREGDAGEKEDRGWRSKSAIWKAIPNVGGVSTILRLLEELMIDGLIVQDKRRIAGRVVEAFRAVDDASDS